MKDPELMTLVDKYFSDLEGVDALNSIKIHANMAGVNTKYISFQGADRIVVYNVFKTALSQNKLNKLLWAISQDVQEKGAIKNSSNLRPRLEIYNWAKYIFIGNALANSQHDIIKGYIVNPMETTIKVIIRVLISGSSQENYISLDVPGNSKMEIPMLQIPRFNNQELRLINRSLSPATITLKLFFAGEESLLDVFQAQTLISQPDFILIARELGNGIVEDHSHILSWLVNSGANGVNKFIEAWVMPQLEKSTGYLAGTDNENFTTKEFVRKQAMAVYDGIKSLNLNYLPTELLTIGPQERMILQRVQNPDDVLAGQSTYLNCLDGVILFSSIIERLNLDPIIILLPGHSIVGWKCFPNADCNQTSTLFATCEFLDITLASDKLDFYSAMSAAEAYIIKYFPRLMDITKKIEEYANIVDVKLSRRII